jgi:hypothetical protein
MERTIKEAWPQRRIEQLNDRLRRALVDGTPIIVGPWTDEVGYELLYWIPFVRWVVDTWQIPREQLLVISRGGPSSWYGDLAYRYADVFSLVTLDEWKGPAVQPQALSWAEQKRLNNLGKEQFHREVLRRIQRAYDLPHFVQLSPDVMFELFQPYWKLREPIAYLKAYTCYASITPPPPRPELPFHDYVAVRFYASAVFPDENRTFAQEVIERIGRDQRVVLLNQPHSVDDHVDIGTGTVYAFGETMPLATNLEIQTSVIGHARAFISTFGGLSYLAAFVRVPSVAVHSELSTARLAKRSRHLVQADLDAAAHVFAELNQRFFLFDKKIGAEKLVRRVAERLGW